MSEKSPSSETDAARRRMLHLMLAGGACAGLTSRGTVEDADDENRRILRDAAMRVARDGQS